MKQLMTGLSYDIKITFLVSCYQKYIFFHFFGGHIGIEMNKSYKSNKF